MQKITIPYGYNTLQIGTLSVHTAKIRVKTDMETVNEFISMEDRVHGINTSNGNRDCVIISWATTDNTKHQQFISKMNRILAHVMHKRIAIKYCELIEQAPDLTW
jgi:hypothetical protein